MRTHAYLLALIATGLVLGAAGPALADDASGNETASHRPDRAEMKAKHDALKAARNASLASFKENRTAALAEYHAAHNATKASFLENKTRVLAECQALKNTTDDKNATQHCVRDGLKPLIEKARAEHRAAKDAFHAKMQAARAAAMEQFRAAREQWRADHPSG